MPTNLDEPGDNFHPEHSHVPAALLRRFHEAKETAAHSVTVWGTGRPLREFLHVDDLADACVFLMKNYSASEHINIGTGKATSIAQFAETIRRSEERRVGKACDSTCRFRWSAGTSKKKRKQIHCSYTKTQQIHP